MPNGLGARTTLHRAVLRAVDTICAEMGRNRIDLPKVDIEGAEHEVMPALDLKALDVRVLCVE